MKPNENYYGFMKLLNKHSIDWCLIKDYNYLMKTGYDNEIDLIVGGRDRRKIRNLAKQNGWNESALNGANTHLIFWKFEGLKPFRIDIHLDRALATAVPWFKANDILKDKIKRGNMWIASPKWELGILLLSSFRGRFPKSYRIKRAKELKNYLVDTKIILKNKLTEQEIKKYYDALVSGRISCLSKLKRLGILGILKEKLLLLRLFLLRTVNPAKVVVLNLDCGQLKLFNSILINSKLNFKIIKENSFQFLFLRKFFHDLIIVISNKERKVNIDDILKELYSIKSS